MSTDDKMREIEAALESLIDRAAVGRGVADQRIKVRALIRAAIAPQADAEQRRSLLELHGAGQGLDHRDVGGWGDDDNRQRANAEHEAKVEAWVQQVKCLGRTDPHKDFYLIEGLEINEALRLMRARPTTEAGPSALERLRVKASAVNRCLDEKGRFIWDEATRGAMQRVLDWIDEEMNNG